jgi:hypothetical protein
MFRLAQLACVTTVLTIWCSVTGAWAQDAQTFRSASTVDEVRRRIAEQPADDSWWTVNGEAMAWNNKNLSRLFPTVNVYRDGPVSELERRPMPEIGDFEVDIPSGEMRFADFLRSDLSTWHCQLKLILICLVVSLRQETTVYGDFLSHGSRILG